MVEREDKDMVLKMVVEEDPAACCCTVTLLEKRNAGKQTVKVKSERCVRGKWGKKEFVIPFSAKRHISGVVDNGARVRMERQNHGVDVGLFGRAVPSRVASRVRERRQAGRAAERGSTLSPEDVIEFKIPPPLPEVPVGGPLVLTLPEEKEDLEELTDTMTFSPAPPFP